MATTAEQPWTIGRLLGWTEDFLGQKGSESPRLDAQVLLAHALACRRIDLYARWDEEVGSDSRRTFRELVRRRIEGCPVAYLVGRKEFYSLAFEVGPDALIPRPDSETAVDECLRLIKEQGHPAPVVLDVGTGCGNLAVAVAHYCKTARVTAVDLSAKALAVAERNAAAPYIPRDDLARLPPGVRDYEPHLALDGGRDGFAVFDRLVAAAPEYLQPGGWLIIEIGSPQEKRARAKIEGLGRYELEKTVIDSSGHPRVLKARLLPAQ
jgi:release factor glutamine methyltransferase